VALLDQPGLECLGGELGTANDEVIFLTALGSKSRSIRVLAVDTTSSVLEYANLWVACQISAESRIRGDRSASVGSLSQPTIKKRSANFACRGF
jgi:hypothetical protein